LGLDVATDLHPLTARDRLHDAWVTFLEELAAPQPLIVLVEDVHWAEEPLLDLLERIVRDVRAPLLLLATARPELLDTRPSWGGGRRNSTILGLEPLSAVDAGRLLDELLASDLPASVTEAVVARAEGNPFFVEELVGTLIDEGLLRRDNGEWHAEELPVGYAVPDSVQAVLSARIDLLDDREKAALQAAAVIGRAFWPGPVRVLLGEGEPDFEILEERDFIRRRAGSSLAGESEFAFKHALTREVAYSSLPKARRARLHAAFAGWLERVGEGRDEWAALLAHHFAEAVRPEDSDLAWSDEAAELERLRENAVQWLRRAAENPNRRLRLTALADRVAMRVDRASFDDLVTLVTQAPTWEKDRAQGVRILLRAIGDAKPDAPEQILWRWTWRLARAVRKTLDRKASSEFPEAKRLLGALANSRGHRHEENAAKLVNAALEQPPHIAAALLASAEAYTPRATNLLEAARERIGTVHEVASALAENLPAPKLPSGRRRRRRRRKKKGAQAQQQQQQHAQQQQQPDQQQARADAAAQDGRPADVKTAEPVTPE
jgi:hypothetical protein